MASEAKPSHRESNDNDNINQNSKPLTPIESVGLESLSKIRYIIAIASGKGGVGKSTVSAGLAIALQKQGFRVGLLDADIYGPSQAGMLGAKHEKPDMPQGLLKPLTAYGIQFISMANILGDESPVVWRAPMAVKMIHQFLANVSWGLLDFLLIDLPPGTGDVQLSLAQQASLSGAIIVTTPQEVALAIAKKGLRMFQTVNVPILGIIENMSGHSCEQCGHVSYIFKQGGGEKIAQELGCPFLGAIPLDTELMKSGDDGIPLAERNPEALSTKKFHEIAGKLNSELEKSRPTELEPEKMGILESGEISILWRDDHQSRYTPYGLRIRCACALCVEEISGKCILEPDKISPEIRFQSVRPQGRYALHIAFSDGHQSGIYPFKRLREICECPDCAGAKTVPLPRQNPSSSPPADRKSPPNQEILQKLHHLLEHQINPSLASHGGHVSLVDATENTVYLRLSGGCQGCGMAAATLRQGIENAIRKSVPSITQVIDVTDHEAGTSPYYKKRGQL